MQVSINSLGSLYFFMRLEGSERIFSGKMNYPQLFATQVRVIDESSSHLDRLFNSNINNASHVFKLTANHIYSL